MTRVHLLTGEAMPKPDPESHLLVAALEELGARPTLVAWTDPAVGREADVVVVRTPWDYPARRKEFLDACRAFEAPLFNPPDVLAWNSHKGYLAELGRAGAAVVPTRMVGGGQEAELTSEERRADLVIKPAVSSGARGAARFEAGDPGAPEHLVRLVAEGDTLVQPYAASVEAGERALVFFDGRFSHAVNKVPAAGDYRVQDTYGGAVEAHEPTPAEVEVSRAALAAVPGGDLLYARVDLVEVRGAPAVMELEAIEPELFLGAHASAPERLAHAILARA